MTTELVVTTAPPRSSATELGSWWIADRSALRVDLYRVLIGAALVFHFYRAWYDLPQAIGQTGLYWPGEPGDDLGGAASAFKWVEERGSWAQLVSAMGGFLSLGIMFGLATKPCAAVLLVVSIWIHRITFASTSLDDALVCVVAFWLCLLPSGKTLRLSGISQWRGWRGHRVEGWSTRFFVVHLFLLHAVVELWRAYAPSWNPAGPSTFLLCLIPAVMLVPSAVTRFIGVGALLTLHFFLARTSGLAFTHAAMMASAPLLLWDNRDGSRSASPRPKPFSATAAVGLAVVALTSVVAVRSLVFPKTGQPQHWAVATAFLLRDAGLLVSASGRRLPLRPLGLRFEADGRVEELHLNSPRAQLLLNDLAVPTALDGRGFHRIAEGAVRLRCRDGRSESGRLSLTVAGTDESKAIGGYRCGPGAAELILRDESQR